MLMIRVIDPGHIFELLILDDPSDFAHRSSDDLLTFVKRFDPEDPSKYPGNANAHPGTTLQSVIRACLSRFRFLEAQIPDECNQVNIHLLRQVLYNLELRAAKRHGMVFNLSVDECETLPMCTTCGHVICFCAARPIVVENDSKPIPQDNVTPSEINQLDELINQAKRYYHLPLAAFNQLKSTIAKLRVPH